MTLSYNVGLTGGALAAYLLEKLLGPAKLKPCSIPSVKTERVVDLNNFTTKPITRVATMLTTTAAVHVVKELTTAPSTLATVLSVISNVTIAQNITLNNEIH